MEKERRNRNKIEVIEAILRYIEKEGKARKTRILYAANLNTHSLESILSDLVNNGALEIINDGRDRKMYRITPRGARLLMLITRIRKFMRNEHATTKKLIDNLKEFCREIGAEGECVEIEQSTRLGISVRGQTARTYFIDLYVKINEKEYIIGFLSKDATELEIQQILSWLIIVSLDTGYSVILFVSEDKLLNLRRYLDHLFGLLECEKFRKLKDKFIVRELRIL